MEMGLFASILSLIPGGFGVMEGSMAAVYYSLTVPLEEARITVEPLGQGDRPERKPSK